jgi:hypothetical protein
MTITCHTNSFAMAWNLIQFVFGYPQLLNVHEKILSRPSTWMVVAFQFQGSEEHWNNDGMQSLPVWGKETADIQNTYWDVAQQIRGGDSHCSNLPCLGIRPGQARSVPAWGRGQNVWRPWGLSPLPLSKILTLAAQEHLHLCVCQAARTDSPQQAAAAVPRPCPLQTSPGEGQASSHGGAGERGRVKWGDGWGHWRSGARGRGGLAWWGKLSLYITKSFLGYYGTFLRYYRLHTCHGLQKTYNPSCNMM